MLSVENSPPTSPDPHLILKPTTTANPQNHELDLPPLPHFSIRDYVSTARSNDIKRNWPFSLKNLQLCLKHGVKDVLPPFQPLDAVRNQAFINKTSSVVRHSTVTLDNNNNNNYYHDHQSTRNIINDEDDHQPSRSDHHDQLITTSSKNLPDQYHDRDHLGPNIASCGTTGDNCFPSSTTNTPSVYDQSEIIEESVVIPRSTSSPLLTDTTTSTSLEAASVDQVAAEPAAPRVTGHKSSTQSTTRNSGKRCRLIVKFGSNSDRNSAEDIASNCTNQSETMASKICPVCKTFSSPSNTTLNAHIDQCLSAESSAPKWTLDSKLTRHRIKPRKTRLMVDIYAMAKRCTLEDLDRRNGSNWAAFSSFPSHEESEKSEMTPVEEQTSKQEAPPHDHHQTSSADQVGAVYIDANGIKLRILSKSDDIPSVSKVIKEHLRPRKPYKGGGKGSKFLSARKSKRRASKFNKYFKVKLAQGKKLLSTKARSSQISGVQGKKYGAGTSYKKERSNMQKQINVNPCNTGTLQWACSKRTGVAKKLINKVSHQLVQYSKWQVSTENLGVGNNQSRAHSPTSGPENREEQLVDLSGNIPVSNIFYDEAEACHKEEERSSGSKTRGHFVERSSFTPMKRNARQLRKERATVNDYHMPKPPYSELASAITSTKPSRSCHASRSKSMKISSARNDLISSALERSRAHSMTEMDDEVVLWDSELDHGPYDFNHNFAASQYGREDAHDATSLCRSSGLEMRRNTGVLSISRRKETVRSESSQLPSQYYADKEVENMDSSVLDKVDDDQGPASEDFQHSVDEIIPQASPKLAVAENLVLSSHKSVELDNHALQYKGPICDVEVLTGPSGQHFAGGQEMFYADQLGNGMEELDSDVRQGSSFPDVDPIPIPGPPGSFLPSPRDMGSDDFQGNSSLTTSRVQSSQDQHDFVDGDSSDSPVSATSTVSNSTGSRYDLKCSEPLVPSVVAPDHAVRDHKFKSSLSGGSVDSSIESAAVIVPQMAERLAFNKEKFKVNNKLPQSFIKSDHDEPCCCQRKERASQGVMLNYQESPLLKRRAMASSSVVLPPMEKQSGCNLNTIRPNNAESRLPDIFSPRPEKVVLPVTSKSPASENISRGGSGESAGVKFSGRGDYDSVSPSSSNSILRLMGKNLMVVNRDQDESMPTGQSQPQSQINHRITSQFSPFSGVSQSQVHHHSFHPNFQQGSVFLGQDGYPHYDVERQCVVDARTSTSFPRPSPQMFCSGAASSFPNQHVRGGFATPMELREFKADHNNGAAKKSGHRSPIGAPLTIPAHHHCQNVLSPASANYSIKEIITIDDVSENEADLAGHGVVKYSGGLREEGHVVSTSGIVIPTYNNDTKYGNPFFTACPLNQDQQSILPDNQSPLVLPNTGFHSLPSSRQVNNTSPVRWNGGGSGGSSGVVLQQSPFIASTKSPSSRGGHLRSAVYNCQSLM